MSLNCFSIVTKYQPPSCRAKCVYYVKQNRRSKYTNEQAYSNTFVLLPCDAAMLAWFGNRNSVRPSVRLSVTLVLCDNTRKRTADILIPHERAIT